MIKDVAAAGGARLFYLAFLVLLVILVLLVGLGGLVRLVGQVWRVNKTGGRSHLFTFSPFHLFTFKSLYQPFSLLLPSSTFKSKPFGRLARMLFKVLTKERLVGETERCNNLFDALVAVKQQLTGIAHHHIINPLQRRFARFLSHNHRKIAGRSAN